MKKLIITSASIIIFSLFAYSIFYCVENAYTLTTKYTDAYVGKLLYFDINAFDGINTLFTGLAFLVTACTLITQASSLYFLGQSNKSAVQHQEYNSILSDITALRSALHTLNETYLHRTESEEYDSRDPNLAGCFSTKIYYNIVSDYEKFKKEYKDGVKDCDKEKVTDWLQNQIHYHTQPFIRIIYIVRSIFSRIDNSDILQDKDKLTLRDSLFFSMSHVDYKVLQLVYLRGSMWHDYGKNKYFGQVFSDELGKIIITQSTEGLSQEAVQFIYHALKTAEPKTQNL